MAPLAQLWHAAWHTAHAAIVPPGLTALRDIDSFARRLGDTGDRLRVAGPVGAPLGMCIVRHNRVDQLYLAADAWGTGLARALLDEAETRLRAAGIAVGELDCAEANHRAARFYVKAGWERRGVRIIPVETVDGQAHIPVICFDKNLAEAGQA